MNNVGDGIKRTRGSWNFGGNIPENFKKHISKSVPLYNEGHNLICDLSDFYVKKNSIIYEIGCSTGSLISKLSNHNKSKTSAKFIGIDIEKDMINFAQKKLDKINNTNLSFVCDDILTFALEPSDMIISYYTMQFINPSIRQQIIDKIYNNLKSGGVLLLFEKVRGADARTQDLLQSLYTDFKIRNGYTPEDIFAKDQSLKGILEPFSSQENLDMLKRAGFKDIITIQKYICFEGFLSIK